MKARHTEFSVVHIQEGKFGADPRTEESVTTKLAVDGDLRGQLDTVRWMGVRVGEKSVLGQTNI